MDIFAKALANVKSDGGGDFVDRLNYQYTVVVLILCAATISAKQYVGQPIQCWVPAQFTKAMEQYTENYCWVQNTYFVQWTSEIPDDNQTRLKSQISYYQWVPFILLGQAVLFYFPYSLWKLLNLALGIHLGILFQMVNDVQCADVRIRDRVVSNLVSHVESTLKQLQRGVIKNKHSKLQFLYAYKKFAPSFAYLLMKLLFAVNAIAQLFTLNAILSDNNDYTFGLSLLSNIIKGVDWQVSGSFPRTTLCDFNVRVLGNLHRYTVQCVLMINMFNEKLFIFLWFWISVVAAMSSADVLYMTWRLLVRHSRKSYVDCMLLDERFRKSHVPKHLFKVFVDRHLSLGGVLMINLIDTHSGVVVASRVTVEMWLNFLESVQRAESRNFDRPTRVTIQSTSDDNPVFNERGSLRRSRQVEFDVPGLKTV